MKTEIEMLEEIIADAKRWRYAAESGCYCVLPKYGEPLVFSVNQGKTVKQQLDEAIDKRMQEEGIK